MTLSEKLRLLFRLYDLNPEKIEEMAKECGINGVSKYTVERMLGYRNQDPRKVDRLVLAFISMIVGMPFNIIGKESIEEIKKYYPPISGTYDSLMDGGRNLARGGNFPKAIKFFYSAGLKAGNENEEALAYHNIAQCYLNLGIHDFAEEFADLAQKTLTDIDRHWETSYLLLRIMANQKKQRNMARLLSKGLREQANRDEQRADISAFLAMLESYAGQYDEAIKQIELAIDIYDRIDSALKEAHSLIRRGYYEFLKSGSTEQLNEMEKAHSRLKEEGADFIDLVKTKNLILRVLMMESPEEAKNQLINLLNVCEEWEFWDRYFFGKVTLYDAAAGESERKSHLDDIVKVWPKLSSWNPDRERFKGILEEKEDT